MLKEKTAASAIMAAMAIQPSTSVTRTFSCSAQEDLDNEDVILQVENTPTYKRTRQTLEEIRNIASGNTEPKEDNNDDASSVQGVISFA